MTPAICYNREAKIAAVGPSVWGKLGPEEWFTQYRMVCGHARGFAAGYVVDLKIKNAGQMTTQQIVDLPGFQDAANGPLAGYRFVVYGPVQVPPSLGSARFIAPGLAASRQFEDKQAFRELFADTIAMPAHRTMPFDELVGAEAEVLYARFAAELGEPLVLQARLGSGGRGTFILHAATELSDALATLRAEHREDVCVISQFIDGTERSMQACVTASGVVLGPVQQQLVRNPELLNPGARGGMYFCGGRLADGETPAAVREYMQKSVVAIGEKMRAAGFRGLYGVDFLIDTHGTAYALEINARPTGMQPLLKEQNNSVPLYLLHILELAGEPYELTSPGTAQADTHTGPGSFLVLFNKGLVPAWLGAEITTGNYRLHGSRLQKIDGSPRWNPEADILLQPFCSPGHPAGPNLKLCAIFLRGGGFDDAGTLRQDAREVLSALGQYIVTEGM